MRATFCLGVLLWAGPVYADMPTQHKVGLSVYATGASLDLHSTYRALSRGAYERNPLGKLTEGSPAGTVAVGAAADAVTVTLLYRWLGKDHPKLTTTLLYVAAGVRAGIAWDNYRRTK